MKTRRRLGTPHRLQGDVELKKEERKKKTTEQDRPSPLLSAFAKLRKATISFVMSDRPSAWNSAPTRRIFMKFDI